MANQRGKTMMLETQLSPKTTRAENKRGKKRKKRKKRKGKGGFKDASNCKRKQESMYDVKTEQPAFFIFLKQLSCDT